MAVVLRDERLRTIPRGDVVVSVPTVFLRSVIGRVCDDVVGNVTLSLAGLKAHVAKKVKKVVPIGEFVLDVDIHEVVGRLRPARPDIRFGGNRVTMVLPVTVSEGHGEAMLHFVWDGKNVAGLTCGDMDVTQKVSGSVVPASYEVSGTLLLEFRGHQVLAVPKFPETRVNIRVTPSPESWQWEVRVGPREAVDLPAFMKQVLN